jgi:hypothetical protein
MAALVHSRGTSRAGLSLPWVFILGAEHSSQVILDSARRLDLALWRPARSLQYL